MVFVHAKIGELKVKDLSQKLQGISGFIFHLQLCEGQQLKHQILLKSHTEWVTTLCQGIVYNKSALSQFKSALTLRLKIKSTWDPSFHDPQINPEPPGWESLL